MLLEPQHGSLSPFNVRPALKLKDGGFLRERMDGAVDVVRYCPGCNKQINEVSFGLRQDGRPLKFCRACRIWSSSSERQRWGKHALYNRDLHRFLRKIYSTTKAGAANRQLGFGITSLYVFNCYFEQNGLCAISGVPLTYLHGGNRMRNWSNASIDRKDSTLGYTPENVHVVSRAINVMKNCMTIDELRFWCAHVVLANAEDDE